MFGRDLPTTVCTFLFFSLGTKFDKKWLRGSKRAVSERRFRGSAALLVVLTEVSTFWNDIVISTLSLMTLDNLEGLYHYEIASE